MKTSIILSLCALILLGCKEETTQVTQIIGPADWQPPIISWLSPPEAELRGTVGLDVTVTDSSTIDRVTLFVDGRENQSINQSPYRFELHSDSLLDGVHLCEVRASDQYGNLGISPVLRVYAANGFPEGIRLLWVPDSFATIQAAINASQDDDTIRVWDGTYYETLNLFGKGIWIESEHGPVHCVINGAGASNVLFAPVCAVKSTLRGFTVTGAYIQVFLDDGAQMDLVNNLFMAATWDPSFPYDSTYSFIVTGSVGGNVTNNLFSGSRTSLQLFSFLGDVKNNIIQFAYNVALWNADLSQNPVFHAYNLFWQNGQDYLGFSQQIGEFNGDPLIDIANGELLPTSPCVDAGDSTIFDLDGTRSDIGPFGGPEGYR